MNNNKKYEPIKESRHWYFVEYYPPKKDSKFAVLQLMIIESGNQENIASAMEIELKIFLTRYPIPIMVSSFDKTGKLVDLNQARSSNHLVGFINNDDYITEHWGLVKDEEIPDVALNQEYVDILFSGLAYKTYAELDFERRTNQRRIKTGWIIFFIWLVVIPVFIELLEYYSNLLSLIALVFCLIKALKKGLELIGKWPKSEKAKEKERKEQLKNHYFYHCEMNPEGFRKIMIQNLEKMSENEIIKEGKLLSTMNDQPIIKE